LGVKARGGEVRGPELLPKEVEPGGGEVCPLAGWKREVTGVEEIAEVEAEAEEKEDEEEEEGVKVEADEGEVFERENKLGRLPCPCP
jgi:hypothetical protein